MTTTPSTTVTAPPPGRYRIDPACSSIAVRTKHLFGMGTVHATFALQSADIEVADRLEDSRITAAAPAASFDSQNPGRDKRVRSKAFLDAAGHPVIGFVSHAVSQTDGTWTVHGTLTARGKEAPCDLVVAQSTGGRDALTVVATCIVDRYALGLTGAKGFAARYVELTITAVSAGR